LTLYTTPVIYLFFDELASKVALFRHRRSGTEPGMHPAPATGD
jgi:hypothetical protein